MREKDTIGDPCCFILDPLRSRPGGELFRCGRLPTKWDITVRGWRCASHHKPRTIQQAPGSRTRPRQEETQ